MALELGAFSNNASTARVDLGNVTVPTNVTYFVWAYRNGEGGGNAGRMFGRSTGVHDLITFNTTHPNSYAFGNISGLHYYYWTRPDARQWASISISGNTTDSVTAPTIYQNGVKPSLTKVGSTFWGTLTSVPMMIANRTNDFARVWDGMLAHFCMWDVNLTDEEHEALHAGALPNTIRPESIVRYFPLLNNERNLFGSDGTNVSCLFSNLNPPVFDLNDTPVDVFYASAAADTSLDVNLSAQSTLTGGLITGIAFNANLSGQSTLSSELTTSIRLNSGLLSQSTLAGSLTTAIPFAANLSAQSSISAEFASAAAQLQSNLTTQATLTSSLTTAIALSSSLTSVASLISDLSGTAAQLQTSLTAQATASGNLTTGIALSGNLSGQSSLSAALAGGAAQLQSNLQATVGLTANLSTQISLSSSLAAQSVLNAALTTNTGMAVNAVASSLLIAGITTQIRFNAALQSQSMLTALIEGAAINAPLGSGYMAGLVKSSRPDVQGRSSRITSNRSRPTYN